MANLKWRWITFHHAKSHMVCAGLAKTIINDLIERECEVHEDVAGTELFIDMPGMICVVRPVEAFNFHGLKLEIPSEDLSTFLVDLQELTLRGKSPRQYVKMHGFMRCLVLSPAQRNTLVKMFKERLPKAEARATEFWATRKSPALVLREAAAKVSGKPLESIPDLGGHRVDRFIPKNRNKGVTN